MTKAQISKLKKTRLNFWGEERGKKEEEKFTGDKLPNYQ
jgi:hypothetical protein